MAGAFIIEGGALDSLVAANNIKERILVLQEIAPKLNLMSPAGPGARATLINGKLSPVIRMRPGEVQRWRFVNAAVTPRASFKFTFQDIAGEEPMFYAIARDGVQYAPDNYTPDQPDTLIVAPGNRLDVFVKAPTEPGIDELENIIVANLDQRVFRALLASAQLSEAFLKVEVVETTDEDYARDLPQTLPPLPSFLANLDSTNTKNVEVIFSETGSQSSQTPPKFFIGKPGNEQMQFNPDEVFLSMPLDSTETWKVVNYSYTVGAALITPSTSTSIRFRWSRSCLHKERTIRMRICIESYRRPPTERIRSGSTPLPSRLPTPTIRKEILAT